MDLQHVELEIADQVALVRINRPQALNALNRRVLDDLRLIVARLKDAPDVRACVLTGAGEKAFVAGADIKEFDDLTETTALQLACDGQALMQSIEDLPIPVITALNGFALGGGLELALATDVIIAADTAKWGLPEVTLGLIPGYGGTQRLSRNVGRTIARRVTLSGEVFTAQQGYDWGLFARVVPSAEVVSAARALARTLTQRAPRAVAWAKCAINHGADQTLARGMEIEAELFAKTFGTKDHVEGVAAFTAKRPPAFEGR